MLNIIKKFLQIILYIILQVPVSYHLQLFGLIDGLYKEWYLVEEIISHFQQVRLSNTDG